MNQSDIEAALCARIANADLGWSIAWPNQDVAAPSAVPRLEVFIDRNFRTDITLSGGAEPVSVGLLRVVAIVRKGSSTRAALDKCDQLAALFPKGQRIAATGGTVILTDAADIRAGFINGPEYAIPIVAPYRAEPS